MISLGLATLVVQWRLASEEKKDAERQEQYMVNAAVVPATQVQEPTFEITYPAGSPYQDLAWPDSTQPDPFQQVQQISMYNANNPNWAGKDTDMRLLLEAHQNKPYYAVLQQLAANEMLRNELFHHYYQDPTSEGMLQAIGFYTQQLLEAKSEDAKLIYMCLRALKDYWPQKQIAQAAQITAQRVQAKPVTSGADTATTIGYHRQVYARVLKKMAAPAEKNQ